MLAPAKINLFLHVGPAKDNGRHDLDSLVMFAGPEASDRVEARRASALSLTLDGPLAAPELATTDNLVLRTLSACASRGLRVPPMAIVLHKYIPVAAGLGGGSADAGAMLRQLVKLGTLTDQIAWTLAASLGGDVPAAYLAQACRMQGEGQIVRRTPKLPDLPTLLVNPGLPCPTGPVFQAFDEQAGASDITALDLPAFDHPPEMIAWLRGNSRNDLEAPAIELVPEIRNVLDALSELSGCALSRMSGSGASCFALFETRSALVSATDALKSRHPNWWIAPTLLKGG